MIIISSSSGITGIIHINSVIIVSSGNGLGLQGLAFHSQRRGPTESAARISSCLGSVQCRLPRALCRRRSVEAGTCLEILGHIYCSLKSLKGEYIGDDIGDYYSGYERGILGV